MYPIRGAVTFKSPVGTNVASDALANLASGGVTGGALIIVGEDYGEGSSIMQERSHAYAMKSQIWLLDPRPDLESIVRAVETGFELSEASNTPVMLEVRIRACHVRGSFRTKTNQRPTMSVKDALEAPRRDTGRVVLPPASYVHEKEKIEKRWPAAVKFIKERGLNEFVPGDIGDVGIILQGGMYNGVMRALQGLGLADVWGTSRIPALCDERHLSAGAGRGRRLLPQQARGAAGGGGPARLHRAGAVARSCARPASRHRSRARTCSPWPANTPPRSWARRSALSCGNAIPDMLAPAVRASNAARRRWKRSMPARWPRSCRRVRPASAPAAPSGRSSPP